MSKSVSRLKSMKKVVEKINHSPKLHTYIPAGMATASPPLGPVLGQRGINIAAFCKEFNERTAEMKPGIPIPTSTKLNPDRTHTLVMQNPPFPYFLKQAAGISRGAMDYRKEVAGMVTVKHVYEIAKIKQQDVLYDHLSLEEICGLIVDSASTIGIKVVHRLDPEEYGKFLEERKLVVEQQKKELQEIKEAKMLRTAVTA